MSVVEEGQQRKKRIRKRKSRTRNEDTGGDTGETILSSCQKEEHNDDPSIKKAAKVTELLHEEGQADKIDDEESKACNKGEEGKGKRKRKRIRGNSTKEQNEMEMSAAAAVAVASSSSSSTTDKAASTIETGKDVASMKAYVESLGDPHDRNDIMSEKTKNALAYIRQFHLDREHWKFNKAKQEYLIRHMFTLPLEKPSWSEPDTSKEKDGMDKEIDSFKSQYWPNEWNRCVAKYFATIQGQAKQRLFDTLTRASQQVIPVQVPIEPTKKK